MTDLPRYIQIKDNPKLVKDRMTGAVLNTDMQGLHDYKKQKALMARKEDKIARLEADVAELKALVHLLVQDKK